MPVSSVRAGMAGQALTVVRGSTPQPFAVEVLGVMTNGIGAGRDLIVIEASDLPGRQVISQGGGIWAGMSGSPVYIGGKLLGAVAYGFSASPSPIGGVTPAADMVKLLTMSTSSQAAAKAEAAGDRTSVALSPTIRQQVAERAERAAPPKLERLAMPLAVGGLGLNRLARLQEDAAAAGHPVVAHAGAGRAAASVRATSARPRAGGNFAATLSYGDLTASGAGTTTFVCDKQALAFGHPLNFAGASTYGADDAVSLAIIKGDTSQPPFKLATLKGPFGTVDQDRLAGLRAKLGSMPATTPVIATIRNVDSKNSRRGVTRVTDPALLPGLAPFAVVANYDATFDEIGDGRATSTWTIAGTRARGVPFTVTRSNRWASRIDIAAEPAFDLGYALDQLVNNEFEKVTVRRVTFGSSVATAYRRLRIVDLAVSVNGGRYLKPQVLRVKAGSRLRVRVSMRPFQSTSVRTATLELTVPKGAGGQAGALEVVGGVDLAQVGVSEDPGCLLSEAGCGSEPEESLNGIIRAITSAPRNDDLVARLTLNPVEEPGFPAAATAKTRQTSVVVGQRGVQVEVV